MKNISGLKISTVHCTQSKIHNICDECIEIYRKALSIFLSGFVTIDSHPLGYLLLTVGWCGCIFILWTVYCVCVYYVL